MSNNRITGTDIVLNAVIIIAVGLGGAMLTDRLWIFFGGQPWLVCEVIAFLDLVMGRTVGMVLICCGLVAWVLSRLQSVPALMVVAGGGMLYVFPTYFAQLIGARCLP